MIEKFRLGIFFGFISISEPMPFLAFTNTLPIIDVLIDILCRALQIRRPHIDEKLRFSFQSLFVFLNLKREKKTFQNMKEKCHLGILLGFISISEPMPFLAFTNNTYTRCLCFLDCVGLYKESTS
jgi:hypothetical protein